jgi:hypothetical protein
MTSFWQAFPVASLFVTLVVIAVAHAHQSSALAFGALITWFVCFGFWYEKTYIKPSGKRHTGERVPTKEELLRRIADLGKVKNHKK